MARHLSTSSISAYIMCPRRWMLRYVEKVETKMGVALIFGSAFHGAVEAKIRGGEYSEKSFGQHWETAWAKQLEERGDNTRWGKTTPEAMNQLGLRMIGTESIQRAINSIVPLRDKDGKPQIETFFKCIIPGVSIPFVGYIDVIEKSGLPADFKTAKGLWKTEKARIELQPAYYVYGMRRNDFVLPEPVDFTYYVFTKQAPKAQVVKTPVTRERIQWALEIARNVWHRIEAKAFTPASTMGWWCSEKWCDYWKECGRVK